MLNMSVREQSVSNLREFHNYGVSIEKSYDIMVAYELCSSRAPQTHTD